MFIERSLKHINFSLLLGGELVVAVLFVFLLDVRTAFISFTILPLSPLVIANLPFTLVGGALAVFPDGGPLSVGSLVGFVTLFGLSMRKSMRLGRFQQPNGELHPGCRA